MGRPLFRYIALSAEHSADGMLDYYGFPVWREDVKIPPLLMDKILAWNKKLEDRIKSEDTSPVEIWAQAHDQEGLALSRELKKAMLGWKIEFYPMLESGPMEEPPACMEELNQDTMWRFNIKLEDLPPLILVYQDTFETAMAEFRKNMVLWMSLDRKMKTDRVQMIENSTIDILSIYLSSQKAIILDWTHDYYADWSQRRLLPHTDITVERYLCVIADNSSDGLWSYQGGFVEVSEVPVSNALKRKLRAWLDLYEDAKTWDEPNRRPFVLEEDIFDQLGKRIAREFKRELPDWIIDYR